VFFRAGVALLWGLLLGGCSLGTDIDVLRERVTGDKQPVVQPDSFTVTFNSNGGSGVATQTVHAGGTATRPANSTLSGFTFENWYSDTELTTVYDFSAPVTGNITLYAKWNAVTYYIAYNANGGTGSMETSSHTYGLDEILNANAFTRTGYTFAGWARTAGGTAEFANDQSVKNLTTVAGATITLYATWVDSSTVWTVRFETNGGSPVGDAVILRNTPVSRPVPDPTRTGYTLDNWFLDEELAILYNFASIISRDTTLYVKWNPITYTVMYDKNAIDAAGTMTNSSHTYGVEEALNANAFTRVIYTFAGWAETPEGIVKYADGESVKNLTPVAGAMITLYAKWTLNRYTVTFNADGGTPAPSQQTIDHGGKVTEPPAMTRTDYTFGGWFKEAALTNQWNFVNDTVTAPTTLYAKWDMLGSGVINVPFTGPTERNIPITRNIANNLSKSGGGSITLTIDESFDRYEWFVGTTNVASGNNVTLQASNAAFITGHNWITAVVYTGTGANAIPWSGEFVIQVKE
jgi:uncharacterized repeat protein (TIGR02543 family)